MTTRDEVLAMAREAGISKSQFMPGYIHATMADIERFHALAVAKEREECARVCEEHETQCGTQDDVTCQGVNCMWICAEKIRARSAK